MVFEYRIITIILLNFDNIRLLKGLKPIQLMICQSFIKYRRSVRREGYDFEEESQEVFCAARVNPDLWLGQLSTNKPTPFIPLPGGELIFYFFFNYESPRYLGFKIPSIVKKIKMTELCQPHFKLKKIFSSIIFHFFKKDSCIKSPPLEGI